MTYPYQDGDTVVLGPEVFASADGSVICWRGENYERPRSLWRRLWRGPAGVQKTLVYCEACGRSGEVSGEGVAFFCPEGHGVMTGGDSNMRRQQMEATSDRREPESRHPATENLMNWLQPNPNLPEPAQTIAGEVYGLACSMLLRIPADGPEFSTGLRKLLEAKDCFVRASMDNPR